MEIMTTTNGTQPYVKAGKARRRNGSVVTLWRVERTDPALFCHVTGRHLEPGEEFIRVKIDGHGAQPVPVCRLAVPWTVVKRG